MPSSLVPSVIGISTGPNADHVGAWSKKSSARSPHPHIACPLQSEIMLLFLSLLMPASLHAMVSVPSRLQAQGSLASSRTLASSTVCSILEPYLPTDLGCSCASAESGVGGTATCSLPTPAVEIIAVPFVGVPSITFEVTPSVML